jgi:hypothetical protein
LRLALAALSALAITLAGGCANLFLAPYTVTLAARDTGATGTGEAPRDWTPGGPVAVTLEGTTYTGEWFHIPANEAVLVARWGPSRWPGRVRAQEMTGTAEMLLIASDTDKLRCQLRFNLNHPRGTGVCQGADGRTYDLRFDPA